MKKYKEYYPVNNQEDEDSSSYPLYPHTEYIYNKAKKTKFNTEGNIEIIEPISKINNPREKGSDPGSIKSNIRM